jgi:hypothetical protein
MSVTTGKVWSEQGMDGSSREIHYINFGTSSDNTATINTGFRQVVVHGIAYIGAPDGSAYVDNAADLVGYSEDGDTNGKIIKTPATGQLTIKRTGNTAGMKCFVTLSGV